LRLINNLAKQKFGNPPRPKSAVSVRSNYSSFHVKSNKEVNIPLLMFFYMFFIKFHVKNGWSIAFLSNSVMIDYLLNLVVICRDHSKKQFLYFSGERFINVFAKI
jgi:hypothetical protein